MDARTNVAPVIIKRKKVIGGGGHHGGAWKVAYADFVTAMMAFFMLMWLLNATTEKQRKGLADYFSPTVPINRVSGGGDGAFGGDSMFAEDVLPKNGTGGLRTRASDAHRSRGETGVDETAPSLDEGDPLRTIEDRLMGRGGESFVSNDLLRHVATRVTDEGLIIELFSLPGVPLFDGETARPTRVMRDLTGMVARLAATVENGVAIGGHTRAVPIVRAENPVWDLSTARAGRSRELLEAAGMADHRIRRVTGHADRRPAIANPMADRNARIEIILLRS
ncbi:flagellar motor protein MotB [Pukyongiella litopenaei]|uniref:OmpA family protein n=1 Tax=Pukyongiella litopenaei TaxID=2605946 RepID=A0A2S0MVB4_9RHOB|nr:flagellar motor protein MotB [Pukyongiella litopenaei]AVO39828.1 OmpA family protein [Pukyongiella litopenaei]